MTGITSILAPVSAPSPLLKPKEAQNPFPKIEEPVVPKSSFFDLDTSNEDFYQLFELPENIKGIIKKLNRNNKIFDLSSKVISSSRGGLEDVKTKIKELKAEVQKEASDADVSVATDSAAYLQVLNNLERIIEEKKKGLIPNEFIRTNVAFVNIQATEKLFVGRRISVEV